MKPNEFYTTIKEHILEFLPQEYNHAKVIVEEIVKPGDVKLHGLSIIKENDLFSPNIYLDECYDMYMKGENIKSILRIIADTYLHEIKKPIMMEIPYCNKEWIKEKVLLQAIDKRTNQSYIDQYPHMELGCDYVAIPYITLNSTNYPAISRLTNDICEIIDMTNDQLLKKAMENTQEKYPAVFGNMLNVLLDMESCFLNDNPVIDPRDPMFTITNEIAYMGAITLFYPGNLQKIGHLLSQNYYILPSSVHEMLIIPEKTAQMTPDELSLMVQEVNIHKIPFKEQMGNRVMYYDRKNDELRIVADKN